MPRQKQFGHVGIGTPCHLNPGLDRRDDRRGTAVAELGSVQAPRGLHCGTRLFGRDRQNLAEIFARAHFDPFEHSGRSVAAAKKIDFGQEQKTVVFDGVRHAVPDHLLFRQIGRGAPDQEIGPLAGPDCRTALFGLHRPGGHLQQADHLQRRQVHLQRDERRVQCQHMLQITAGDHLGSPVRKCADHPRFGTILDDDRRQAQRFGDNNRSGQQV